MNCGLTQSRWTAIRHNPPMSADIESVKVLFLALQGDICDALEKLDGTARFSLERLPQPGGGFGQPCVLQDGPAIEKAAVQFTHSVGDALPPAASERNPHLAGAPFQAAAISVIVHPRNPYVPTTHMNLRFFCGGRRPARLALRRRLRPDPLLRLHRGLRALASNRPDGRRGALRQHEAGLRCLFPPCPSQREPGHWRLVFRRLAQRRLCRQPWTW